jgi:hypothetical protein
MGRRCPASSDAAAHFCFVIWPIILPWFPCMVYSLCICTPSPMTPGITILYYPIG